MADDSKPRSESPQSSSTWLPFFTLPVLLPILAAILVYQLDTFEPAAFPLHELTQPPLSTPFKNGCVLRDSEFVGTGKLEGPEDLIYDSKERVMYTGCADGWIKRVTVNNSVDDSVVQELVNTGGRPLGLVFGHENELIVADADKGLLNISKKGEVKLLTDGAEGVKFNLTDGVDIAENGNIYFSDASYKYNLNDFIWDILEGKPHGRLLLYDPAIKRTTVLARDLYFPNGVTVSPDQDCVVFCETPMRRCKKYYIEGKKKGTMENFLDNLPGMPDNIHFAHGRYWIGMATEMTAAWNFAFRYPFIRKIAGIITRYVGRVSMEKNGGLFVVDLEGNPIAHYHDPELSLISSGIRIGSHIYCGSVMYPYIIRFNLTIDLAA